MSEFSSLMTEIREVRADVKDLGGKVATHALSLGICQARCAEPRAAWASWGRTVLASLVSGVTVGLTLLLLKP